MKDLFSMLMQLDPSVVMLGLMTCVSLLIIWSWHRDPDSTFDLRQMLVDNVSGKVSIEKVGYVVGLMVSTWGFTTLILRGQMTEYYFSAYFGILIAGRTITSGITVYKDVKSGTPTPAPPQQ